MRLSICGMSMQPLRVPCACALRSRVSLITESVRIDFASIRRRPCKPLLMQMMVILRLRQARQVVLRKVLFVFSPLLCIRARSWQRIIRTAASSPAPSPTSHALHIVPPPSSTPSATEQGRLMHELPAASPVLPPSALFAIFDLPDLSALVLQRCDARALASLSCACRLLRARTPAGGPLWGALLSARWPSYRPDVEAALVADGGACLRVTYASLARASSERLRVHAVSRFRAVDYSLQLSAESRGRAVFDSGIVPLEAAFGADAKEASFANTLGALEQPSSGARGASAALRDLLDSCTAVLTVRRSDGTHFCVQLPLGERRSILVREGTSGCLDTWYEGRKGEERKYTACAGLQLVANRGEAVQTVVHVQVDGLADSGMYGGTCDVQARFLFEAPPPLPQQAPIAAADGSGASGALPASSPGKLRIGEALLSIGWMLPGGVVMKTCCCGPDGLVGTAQIVLFAQSLFREASLGSPPPAHSAAREVGLPAAAASDDSGASGGGVSGSDGGSSEVLSDSGGAGGRCGGRASSPSAADAETTQSKWAAAHFVMHINVSLAGAPVFAGRLPLVANPSLPLRWASNALDTAAAIPLLVRRRPLEYSETHRGDDPAGTEMEVALEKGTSEAFLIEFSVLRSDGRVAAAPAERGEVEVRVVSEEDYDNEDDVFGGSDAGGEIGDATGLTASAYILNDVMVDISRGNGWEGGAFLNFRLLFPYPVVAYDDDDPSSSGDEEVADERADCAAPAAATGMAEEGPRPLPPLPPPPSSTVVLKRRQVSQVLMSAESYPGGWGWDLVAGDDGPLRFEGARELLLLIKALFLDTAEV